METTLKDKSILLIISGGIAAYKSLELIRLIKKAGGSVRAILTKSGEQFVTPLSVSALCEAEVYTDLWSLKDETEMGHIRLSREADLIVIAPASADILAKMANGLATDLATTTLLASNKPILAAPAMNHMMWENAATKDNIKKLQERGITLVGPTEGDMACGEYGMGRMSEPEDIFTAISSFFLSKPLKGLKALVTSGPTYEPIDPVRFIGNYSSGKQGHAIASALSQAGADVTLITGPVSLPNPTGVNTIHIETAQDMLNACENTMPADIAICAAAVADWRIDAAHDQKIKKDDGKAAPQLQFTENPDILQTLSNHKQRPKLVIGFAAETNDLIKNAQAKLNKKGCDWILANDVSTGKNGEKVFGNDKNHVYLITKTEQHDWETATKAQIAQTLTAKIMEYFKDHDYIRAAE